MPGLWDVNPVKSDCYDYYTTTDVINSFEQLKKRKKKRVNPKFSLQGKLFFLFFILYLYGMMGVH